MNSNTSSRHQSTSWHAKGKVYFALKTHEYKQKEWSKKTVLTMEHINLYYDKCAELHTVTQSFEFAGLYFRALPYTYNGGVQSRFSGFRDKN